MTSPASPPAGPPEATRARRPQWLVLMLFSAVAYEQPAVIWAGSVIGVLARLGVSSHAARSTLGRMSERGLLERYRDGREVYFGLTARARQVLREGRAVALEPVDRPWDGTWTILTVSLPEQQRALRYRVRSRLAWEGFGQLQNGVWASPHQPDVATALQGLDVMDHVHVFTGAAIAGTAAADLIRKLYDIDEIASRYEHFTQRWAGDPLRRFDDAIPALVLLLSEWAQIVRADPRLPLAHLPCRWPGAEADKLFRRHSGYLTALAAEAAPSYVRTLTPARLGGLGADGSPAGSSLWSPSRGQPKKTDEEFIRKVQREPASRSRLARQPGRHHQPRLPRTSRYLTGIRARTQRRRLTGRRG